MIANRRFAPTTDPMPTGWRVTSGLLVWLLVSGCAGPPPEQVARWKRDSADYARDLAVYVRDSAVVDSIARTVPTDSLVHLYRNMLTDPNPARIQQEIVCEEYRLSFRYGVLPQIVADERMMATVFTAKERKGFEEAHQRLPSMMVEKMGPAICHTEGWPRPPAKSNATSLFDPTPRPTPPRRP